MFGFCEFFGIALLALATVAEGGITGRIVGGSDAVPGEFPYQVSLRFRGRHLCGGAIISEDRILTAAHCVHDLVAAPYSDLTVATGMVALHGGQIHFVKDVLEFPGYNPNTVENDIAIITLEMPISFNGLQKKVDLPTKATENDSGAIATGWGREDLNKASLPVGLKKAELSTLRSEDCQKRVPFFNLFATQICTYHAPGRGTCMGDSGGPLVHDGKLIGVVSYGYPCARGFPDVFTSVYHYIDWIKKNSS